jgi:putative acetyltransferase
VIIERASPQSDEAIQLMRELWAYLDALYGNSAPTVHELTGMEDPRSAFVIAREADAAVGCAALRPMSADIAEVKRMYVRAEARRKGVARQLMSTLEQIARDTGFREIWLETGLPQVAAIELYEQLGYTTIPPYGEYKDEPDSVCYAKRLR